MSTKAQSSPATKAREKSAALRAASAKKHKQRQLLTQVGVIVITAAIVLGIVLMVLTGRDDGAAAAAPDGVTANGSVVVGSPDAPVTITLVEDFGCPACGAFERETGPLLEEYAAGADVKLEYRGIAFLDQQFTDDYPTRALNASAVVAGAAPDAWPAFHALLFANQPREGGAGLTDDQLVDLAVQAGADRAAVEDAIVDLKYADWVEDTTDATLDLDGVEGTPTVFVDGEVVDSTPAAIQQAVDAALDR